MIGTTAALLMAGSAAVGAGATVYSANKAAKSQQAAIAANQQSVDDTNRMNYARWLESQGVGQDGQPVNTWLPRYLTMDSNALKPRPAATSAPAPFLIKKGGG